MRVVFKLRAHSRCFTSLRSTVAFSNHQLQLLPPSFFPVGRARQLNSLTCQPAAAAMTSDAGFKPLEGPEALPADFDKAQFQHTIRVKALRIPTKQCNQYLKLANK